MRYSGASWYKNGFFYGRYDAPTSGQYTAKSDFQKIYYGKRSALRNRLILLSMKIKLIPSERSGLMRRRLEKYLLLYISEGGKVGSLISWKRADEPQSEFKPLISEFGHEAGVIDNLGDKFLLTTDEDAPTNRVVLVDPHNPSAEHYQTLIPARPETIEDVNYVGGKLIISYLKDASNHVYIYETNGKLEREIMLPGIGSAVGFGGKRNKLKCFTPIRARCPTDHIPIRFESEYIQHLPPNRSSIQRG